MRKLIGKGAFSKAYQVSDTEVELVSTCPAKECYAMFSQNNPFAPKIERDHSKENTYKMPLYPKVTAPKKQLNAAHYHLYKALRAWRYQTVHGYQEFTEAVRTDNRILPEDKEYICELAGDVCNNMDCDDMRFEISPRNISHDAQGNLIMLDCFYCVKHLINTSKRK